MLFKFCGETRATFTSLPPGVTVSFRSGEEKELDSGFDHLKHDPRFMVIEPEPATPPPPPEPKN